METPRDFNDVNGSMIRKLNSDLFSILNFQNRSNGSKVRRSLIFIDCVMTDFVKLILKQKIGGLTNNENFGSSSFFKGGPVGICFAS